MTYDSFKVGDKVWSEAFGFGKITLNKTHSNYGESLSVEFKQKTAMWSLSVISIVENGTFFRHSDRPRTFFYAVADTDEGMRAAIARGEGLKRPVPRGRWPIEPEDRVIAFGCDLKFSIGVANVTKESSEGESYPININSFTFTKEGLFSHYNPIPRAMRLYDGEEPFEDPCENMRWMMDEAIKFGWHEKYGKGKNHDTE